MERPNLQNNFIDMEKVSVGASTNKSEQSISKIITPDIEYDPHDYFTSDKPTTFFETLLHILKASLGTGILAMPIAYENAGYIVGIMGVFCMVFIYSYCLHLLMRTEYELCKRRKIPNMTYAKTIYAAFEEGPQQLRSFAKKGEIFTNIIFIIYPTSGASIYAVFIAGNISHLFEYFLQTEVSISTVLLCLIIPFILVNCTSNLKCLVPLSALANILSLISFGMVFYYVFREIPTFENRKAAGNFWNFPTYLTIVLYATSCTNVVMTLKNNMRESKYFTDKFGVFNIAMTSISILYALFGFFGYLKYGSEIEGSITLNLPKNEVLAQYIRGLYSFSIYINYCLYCYVIYDILWMNYLKLKIRKMNKTLEYAFRACVPIVTILIALSVPNLKVIISLVGAICTTTTSLMMPVTAYTLVFYDTRTSRLERIKFLVKNTVLFVFSAFITVIGAINGICDIIKIYKIYFCHLALFFSK